MRLISPCVLMTFVLAAATPAPAQIFNIWNKTDTVTAGDSDDLNPSIIQNAFVSYPGEFLRVIFERHTSTESQIAATRFSTSGLTWDSSIVVISSRPPGEEQKYPGYSEAQYRDTSAGSHIMRLAAWQVRKDNRWQVYYSTFNDGTPGWSSSSVLVTDSLDNTSVQVHPFYDTSFIVTWKRANTIMYLTKSFNASTPAETLAVSSSDSLEYDVCTKFGNTGVIWTSNIGGTWTPLFRRSNGYPTFHFETPETVHVPPPCFRPHLNVSQSGDPSFLFEAHGSGPGDVFYHLNFIGDSFGNLSDDPLSENRNARSFNFPYVTKRGANIQNWIPSGLGLVVYEKYRGSDSSLVFAYSSLADTVRTPGHNRNALVSSQPFNTQTGIRVLVVWESNRSGRSHIYGRLAQLFLGPVIEKPPEPAAFELMQNYPNPFNPSTTIRYSLPWRTHVTVSIFNALGQNVATLVNESKEAGFHEARFDGSGLSSGVYFYRLRAGAFVATKRLVLVR